MDSVRVSEYIQGLKDEFPDLRVYEEKPWWLKVIFHAPLVKKLKWFNYTQTIGMNIWKANNWDSYTDYSKLSTLRHEREHLLQFKKYTLLGMAFLYLFVFFPIGLAYFRAKFEREGMVASLHAKIEYYGSSQIVKDRSRDKYLKTLTSSAYLYAFPFKKVVLKWFEEDWATAVEKRQSCI